MTKRLFVNGLPYHLTGEILENFFLAYGAAFVEMSSELKAEKTIQNLDGTEVEGGTIKVHVAQPRLVFGRSMG